MAGIRSLGWWIPEQRQSAHEIAAAFGLPNEAMDRLGFQGRPVAGEGDHPSTMGARATHAALDAAGLTIEDLDFVIFAGVSKDYPAPWVGAHGVLAELGSKRAGGFDISNRCAAGIDALWLAKCLIDSGTHRTIAVCCAERFDHWLRPGIVTDRPSDAIYSAGAATALVTANAKNDIAGFSCIANAAPSSHNGTGPIAGGSRVPLDHRAIEDGFHLWSERLSIRQVDQIARFSADADRYNYPVICKQAGFDAIDFVACSPIYPQPQLEVLKELGVSPESTLFTIPDLGHIGPADLFLILGRAIEAGRNIGRRIVLSTRTAAYANALALRGHGAEPGIAVSGAKVA
jgi:3-oxoacyl-[acyl-carrier-protein] synthase-3